MLEEGSGKLFSGRIVIFVEGIHENDVAVTDYCENTLFWKKFGVIGILSDIDIVQVVYRVDTD